MNKGNEGAIVVVYATAGQNLATTMVTWSLHLHLQLAPQWPQITCCMHTAVRVHIVRPTAT